MSEEVSYDVYVKKDVDYMGRGEFGEAMAHFVERSITPWRSRGD